MATQIEIQVCKNDYHYGIIEIYKSLFGDLVNPNKLILQGTENLNFDVDYQGEYMVHKEIYIELQDTQWQFDYIDHDRNIARAIVYDENGIFYFVRAEREDRKSTRLNSSHTQKSRMPSSA